MQDAFLVMSPVHDFLVMSLYITMVVDLYYAISDLRSTCYLSKRQHNIKIGLCH